MQAAAVQEAMNNLITAALSPHCRRTTTTQQKFDASYYLCKRCEHNDTSPRLKNERVGGLRFEPNITAEFYDQPNKYIHILVTLEMSDGPIRTAWQFGS